MKTKEPEKVGGYTRQEIKNKWKYHKIAAPFEEFYQWFVSQEQKCCYCGITVQEIAKIAPSTKRNRGERLELEHKIPEKSCNNFDNLALACYWCNNAKTDTFTHDEFQKIGEAIKTVWKDRLKAV